jgi:hypothetical protein
MVCCDNIDDCRLEWFHFACVGLDTKPKGKWYGGAFCVKAANQYHRYCSECQEKPDVIKAKAAEAKLAAEDKKGVGKKKSGRGYKRKRSTY